MGEGSRTASGRKSASTDKAKDAFEKLTAEGRGRMSKAQKKRSKSNLTIKGDAKKLQASKNVLSKVKGEFGEAKKLSKTQVAYARAFAKRKFSKGATAQRRNQQLAKNLVAAYDKQNPKKKSKRKTAKKK